jgi:hypothetical protein
VTEHAPTYHALPQVILDDIQKSMRGGKDSPWDLAGDGWREYVKRRNGGFEKKRNKDFAGPKSAAVEELFRGTLGVDHICDHWRASAWSAICDELDAHLEQRNLIVHRVTPGRVVSKTDVKSFCKVVTHLVACTDVAADQFLTQVTGQSRWVSVVASAGNSPTS